MPEKQYAAAIDLGATSGRVIVGAYSEENLELTEVHRFPNAFHTLNGYEYWDIGGLFDQIRHGLSEAKRQFPGLKSCGVDTWGVDHVFLGRDGRLAFPVHAYRDSRTEPLIEEVADKGDARKLYDWSGLPLINYNSCFQIAETLRAFPHLRDSVERVLFLPDYFNYLLSGTMTNEFSIASTSQLLDIEGDGFRPETFDYFSIPSQWFDGPAKAGRILGPVKGIENLDTVEVALVPGHDTSCAFESIPSIGQDIFVSAGTWLLVGGLTQSPATGDDAFDLGVSNERAGNGGYRPNKILLGLWLFEQVAPAFSERPRSGSEWEALVDAATNEPPAETLIDTTDKALFNPDDMHAAIVANIERQGGEPPSTLVGFMRLICDSLGKSMADATVRFGEMTGTKFDNIIIVGGGSKNQLLCQRAADFSGLPVTSYALEGTSVGNLGYQFLARGVVKDLDQYRAVVRKGLASRTYQPHT